MNTIKICLCAAFALIAARGFAQEKQSKTDERLVDQIKNGTVPGWKFATTSSKQQTAQEDNTKEPINSIKNIRAGKATNMVFATSQSTANTQQKSTTTNQKKLASDNQPVPPVKDSVSVVLPSQQ